MADPLLQNGDRGAAVVDAQDLLNRAGAMLATDGDFGPGTAAAVRDFQSSLTPPLPASGQIDDATWLALRALPEPSPDIPTRAVTFICQEETGGRAYYDVRASRPVWPGGESGVTIGVGYDLGQQTTLTEDWGSLLSADQIAALVPWVGKRGEAAKAAIPGLQNIVIPFEDAWKEFIARSLPAHVDLTKGAFDGWDKLPPLCLGMLVSLVYNRGSGMTDPANDPEQPRREMRQIRDDVAAGNFAAVPDHFRAMKRLWPDSPGLKQRRDAEAQLFEQGLASA